MTLEQFTSFIEAIKKFHEREQKLGDMFEEFNSSWTIVEFCPEIVSSILSYLKSYFEDNDEWITYFMYELDYGTRTDLEATYVDGTSIPLSSIEDLYKLLLENQNENIK